MENPFIGLIIKCNFLLLTPQANGSSFGNVHCADWTRNHLCIQVANLGKLSKLNLFISDHSIDFLQGANSFIYTYFPIIALKKANLIFMNIYMYIQSKYNQTKSR